MFIVCTLQFFGRSVNRLRIMQKSLDYDYIFKYILIGDASVGKSTMLNKFINDSFNSESNPTMGVEFATKMVVVDGITVKIQIWDTAGQESFRTITRAYYKNAIGIVLIYDLYNQDTLKNIDAWLEEIHDNSNQTAEIMIVGNKSDLAPPPSLPPKENITFTTCSAKTGVNIAKVFNGLTHNILQRIKSGEIKPENTPGVRKGTGAKTNNVKLSFDKDSSRAQGSKCC